MNRRSVLGGIAAGLAGLLSRPAKAKAAPLYVFEPQVLTRVLTVDAPAYTQSFVFSTYEPHQAMLAVWMMIATANADFFNVERQIAYTFVGYTTWEKPPEVPPIGSFLGDARACVYTCKTSTQRPENRGRLEESPDEMPEDIEQHSPFRMEWLTHPRYFRHDFTDPYGRW